MTCIVLVGRVYVQHLGGKLAGKEIVQGLQVVYNEMFNDIFLDSIYITLSK